MYTVVLSERKAFGAAKQRCLRGRKARLSDGDSVSLVLPARDFLGHGTGKVTATLKRGSDTAYWELTFASRRNLSYAASTVMFLLSFGIGLINHDTIWIRAAFIALTVPYLDFAVMLAVSWARIRKNILMLTE
jgi:hypothetical protein